MNSYLKIPIELCQFALSEGKVTQAQTYLAGLFLWPGKVHQKNYPIQKLSTFLKVSDRTVYRSFRWLLKRGWIVESRGGWFFFRGLDRIHDREGWKFARAAIMSKKDLKNCKSFFVGAVLASMVITGRQGTQTEHNARRFTRRGSKTLRYPISLSSLADVLSVHESTAYQLRKLAEDKNYIKNEPNLIQITNLTPTDLKLLKASDVNKVPVRLFGYSGKKNIPLKRIRCKKNKLYLQEPNWIYPLLKLKSREGLSRYLYRAY